MTQTLDSTPVPTAAETDLVEAVRRVLTASAEPLTPSKIRALLPAGFRSVSPEELAACLQRQVAADVLYQYPRYRSRQDRFWDRPMPAHVAGLLHAVLRDGPLAWSALRRRLPAYALAQADGVLRQQLVMDKVFRHPPVGKRGRERFGVRPPDAKDYLRPELSAVFRRLAQLGLGEAELRAGALEILHDEEWSPTSSPPEASSPATPGAEERHPAAADSVTAQPAAFGHHPAQPESPAATEEQP
jgi:hypothetical protein